MQNAALQTEMMTGACATTSVPVKHRLRRIGSMMTTAGEPKPGNARVTTAMPVLTMTASAAAPNPLIRQAGQAVSIREMNCSRHYATFSATPICSTGLAHPPAAGEKGKRCKINIEDFSG